MKRHGEHFYVINWKLFCWWSLVSSSFFRQKIIVGIQLKGK